MAQIRAPRVKHPRKIKSAGTKIRARKIKRVKRLRRRYS